MIAPSVKQINRQRVKLWRAVDKARSQVEAAKAWLRICEDAETDFARRYDEDEFELVLPVASSEIVSDIW